MARRPSPPYHATDSCPWRRAYAHTLIGMVSRSSDAPVHALHEGAELLAARREVFGGRHVKEIVDALVALDHDRLDLDRRAVQAAPEHRALSRAPAHSERAALLDDALLEAEGQVARQDVERASKSRVLAGGVGEHAARRRRALELEVGGASALHRPARGRQAHVIALGRIVHAALDPPRAAARGHEGEKEKGRRPERG